MAIAMGLFATQKVLSQSYAQYLHDYCIVSPTAEFILNNAGNYHTKNMSMGEYRDNNDRDGIEFAAEMKIVYELSHVDDALDKVANDIWKLVSKQLDGQRGRLTFTQGNFIPTRNAANERILVVIFWNQSEHKWDIFSIPLSKIKTAYKGVRIFTPET